MSSHITDVFTEIDPQRLEHPVLAFLKAYWDKKRGGRKMPSRADIKPAEMKEHLGWIVLIDVLPDYSDFRYRMVGSRVSEAFPGAAKGRFISETYRQFSELAVKGALATHRKAARDAVPLRTYGSAAAMDREFMDFDAVFLPLSDDGARVNMLLNSFTFTPAKAVRGGSKPAS
jgi:hypothetical protein